jgi:hypothetical protein
MPEKEDWTSRDWEVVLVFDNNGEGDEKFGVDVPGIPPTQWPKSFIWGPQVFKPRELTDPKKLEWERQRIPKGEERLNEPHMRTEYLDGMAAHVDAGGRLSHTNGLQLLEEVRRLRGVIIYVMRSVIIYWEPNTTRGAERRAQIEARLSKIIDSPIHNWGEHE